VGCETPCVKQTDTAGYSGIRGPAAFPQGRPHPISLVVVSERLKLKEQKKTE
jgi:hypothetical protein